MILACVFIAFAVVLSAFSAARASARDARRVADVKQVQEALKLYRNDCESYPNQTVVLRGQALSSGGMDCGEGGFTSIVGGGVLYMKNSPAAPTPSDGCADGASDYVYSGAGDSYSISFCLGTETKGFIPGPHKATENGIN